MPWSILALARRGGTPPPILRVELEEFSQVFASPTDSQGVLRLRCTLLQNTAGGERLVAQRSFNVQRPAPTADAAGGVRALGAATDAAAQEIAAWLRQR
jgi:cholesterol transport system auxiliary component